MTVDTSLWPLKLFERLFQAFNFSIVNNSMGTFDTAVGTYNGFRFRFTSGQVASGTFRLYGVV